MGKHDDASLILKLYELRREEVMRRARNWIVMEFNPETADDVVAAIMGENSAYVRMVATYWDMACSFVTNGAIDEQMFNDANQEHVVVFAKMSHILEEVRVKMNAPNMLLHVETLVMKLPDIENRLPAIRERFKNLAALREEAVRAQSA
ncbi:MAG: hypothetical protein ABIP75_14285 [Pyrinomonadaceae bacterium]